jgi:TRAP-type C4-dicarboxylate transport system substrate-binding protein
MISSFATTPLSAAALQWFGLAKNMADMKWAPLMGGVIVSTKVWNKIKPELHVQLLNSAKIIGKEMQNKIDKSDADAISVMVENGLNITTVSEAQKNEWRIIAAAATKDVVGTTIDEATYNEVLKYVEEYKNLGDE